MFANTVTASPRKGSPTTGLGAGAVIGYRSSGLASSSALIAEISASTALHLGTGAHAAAHHLDQCGGHVPQPPPSQRSSARSRHRGRAVRPRRTGSRPCRTAGSAPPATRPTAAPRRRAGPPADAAAPATTGWTDSTDRSCVYSSHKIMPASAMSINNSQSACHRDERGKTRHRQPMLPAGSPRSVHARATVIWPVSPPEHTNTMSPPRRLR